MRGRFLRATKRAPHEALRCKCYRHQMRSWLCVVCYGVSHFTRAMFRCSRQSGRHRSRRHAAGSACGVDCTCASMVCLHPPCRYAERRGHPLRVHYAASLCAFVLQSRGCVNMKHCSVHPCGTQKLILTLDELGLSPRRCLQFQRNKGVVAFVLCGAEIFIAEEQHTQLNTRHKLLQPVFLKI